MNYSYFIDKTPETNYRVLMQYSNGDDATCYATSYESALSLRRSIEDCTCYKALQSFNGVHWVNDPIEYKGIKTLI